jgi:hypothetical protein
MWVNAGKMTDFGSAEGVFDYYVKHSKAGQEIYSSRIDP